ncbi:MAG: hypothetical protein JO123_04040 [Ktedonobacteraceae bacterium]|nr:hypothetical protein [Ktedonobacteraceae bacterium]
MLSERAKLGLLSFLLLLALGCLAFTTISTIQAVRHFQQEYREVKAGDVSTIHSWMTIHAVSRIYRVPENYLYCSLHISNPRLFRHATLYDIARRRRQPVDQVIYTVQATIVAYRKTSPRPLTSSSACIMKPLPPMPEGRTSY